MHTHQHHLKGSHPGVRQTFPQGGITMISHRADPLPLGGGTETDGQYVQIKERQTKAQDEMKRESKERNVER